MPNMPTKQMPRMVGMIVAALVGGGGQSIGQAAEPAAPNAQHADDPARLFFAQHCRACHSGPKPKGDFRLDSLSLDFGDKANRERWLAVLDQVSAGTMPPGMKPRPPVHEVQALIDWIGGRVAAAQAVRSASQGRVGLRRLNRAEYENTVRDLLGVDVDLKDLLPLDTSTNGFDNSAEALHVSSYLLELLPALTGSATKLERPQPLFWRLHMAPNAKIAMRVDDWKILANAELTQFEIYNLKTDVKETTNLKDKEPQRFAVLRDQLLKHNAAIDAEGPDWWKTLSPNGGTARADEPPAKKKGKKE